MFERMSWCWLKGSASSVLLFAKLVLSFWIDFRFVVSRGLKLMKVHSMSKRWLQ
jgi:hypothetical protein